MSTIDDVGRPEAPVAGSEAETLLGFLDYQRATLAWKCAGLTAEQLAATTAASTMTLGGIVKHMAWVEGYWFAERLHGHEATAYWQAVDWSANPDWEWDSAKDDSPEVLRGLWQEAVSRSRTLSAEAAAAADGLSSLATVPWRDGRSPSLRWILCHMIEEYARHNGHADLLRESIDGQTGE